MILLLTQSGGALPRSTLDLVRYASAETIVVLLVCVAFSVASWFLIGLKWWQFRRLHLQGERFFHELERTTSLVDSYHAVMKLPPSPFHRIFREAIHFVSELRPGALKDRGDLPKGSLTPTQLEALKMILARDVNAERDAAARHIPWLATIGAVGPLLGLLGTVLGVMSAFLGLAAGGSGNLAAVAPGVAEALITTVAGLVAAIPAVIGYNYFATRLGQFEGEMDGFANELVGTMAREGLL
ncbi:MAG: MotA/TolQ/ExbB proton channel family protein [Gemmatimonadales bacterium]